jgi:hypothetical protein
VELFNVLLSVLTLAGGLCCAYILTCVRAVSGDMDWLYRLGPTE